MEELDPYLPWLDDAPPEELAGPLRKVWLVGLVVAGVQFVVLGIWSYHLWVRFDLTTDFATFSQAWNQIGTGNLNPNETTFAYGYPHYGYPFWQSHFELAMWPLSLLRAVGLSAFSLLEVQDLALAVTTAAALRFGLELLQRHWRTSVAAAPWVGAGLLVALVASPWMYWAGSFDFHFQPLALCFLILCARDIWSGRRRAWWWVVAVLLCGDVAASYLIGLGLAAACSGRAIRRRGLPLIPVGIGWIVLVVAVGSGKGSSLAGNYGYLAHVSPAAGVGGTLAVAWGVIVHPADVLHVLRIRMPGLLQYLVGSGGIGILAPLGAAMALVVLVPNALNYSPVFIGADAAFQNIVAVVFVLVGGISVLTWLIRRRNGVVLAGVVGGAALVQVIVSGVLWIPRIPPAFAVVDHTTAQSLSQVDAAIPPGSELVVSQGVIGRFGQYRHLYPFIDAFGDGQTVPVAASPVVFVFVPDVGLELATPDQTRRAEAQVGALPGVVRLPSGPGVTAFLWRPPKGTSVIHFAK